MNIQQIEVTGVEDKGQKIILVTKTGKYEFFKTGWDRTKNAPGQNPSQAMQQFNAMPNPVGKTFDVDVYEKERTFIGKDNKEVTYTQRTINSFLLNGVPKLNPNGTAKAGTAKTVGEYEEIFE